ncbi:hypothetical protein HHL19_16335 [Streptomyces sp. R302]|uniref:hypothetical protein n=1 Tax=unclassified Streptomyces TaxID=2593676 RepID=UPI00145CEE38|nr:MULTISPECIES: hypothetical protein [unclassified Streptomyces]NML55339.1 hypothetical protein [Streptomyces sp. R301]NML80211.1 hypothetical protein [Streptomyces sp. R302]
MTRRIYASDVGTYLDRGGHTTSEGPKWTAGYRVRQDSPRTVRVHHDGPDELDFLDQYARTLQARGYFVYVTRPARRRPHLRITHP